MDGSGRDRGGARGKRLGWLSAVRRVAVSRLGVGDRVRGGERVLDVRRYLVARHRRRLDREARANPLARRLLRWARQRHWPRLAQALLALALVRPWGRHVPDRVLEGANVVVSAVLVPWGGANVLVGGLALAGAVSPADGLDQRALHWHVFVWDLWFLVWGASLTIALSGFRRANRTTVGQRRAVRGAGVPAGPVQRRPRQLELKPSRR